MKDTINLRLKSNEGSLTAMPGTGPYADPMRKDVRSLAISWVQRLGISPEAIDKSEVEFVLDSTLDYIEQLEGVLEDLQADPDTSDELLEEIERVLR